MKHSHLKPICLENDNLDVRIRDESLPESLIFLVPWKPSCFFSFSFGEDMFCYT